MSESRLHFFRGYTLVDITPTKVTHSSIENDIKRNQQRNWETVLQCMGLRTQPLHIQDPMLLYYTPVGEDTTDLIDLKLLKFGELYTGNHRVWSWSWAVEAADIYKLNDNPLGGLNADFENIPVITFLEETALFLLPVLHPHGSIKNIYFKQIETE